ncbi:hypothetical protein CLAFUW4_01774 [Fulvia fulva]|uniref:Copper-fist domain-containing protein n=1 Tax=Passalora fulva TaxID=5499 RepID=A0A9Q8L7B4_PASFU|nr:uncharacterized protein CLAFUR5_01770 [Fulvia fulva]KAK4634054.1 hypothetical protein CLAFUR4_01772 [Fulvia fulva]KAK4637612.1 hypothetical protein CLAFUR0_01774 [Fulvia fulva]UJO12246.1 hypothetical protein CLAFUR5_01770 [Fulvia fulva]WPV10028.1 hypothetical protein CLAFUW4_01774 [Fulvia fulva]WPV23113.1 hypothetical protein CLAFUW7_01776 [Fulvia fulva]
MDQEKPFKTIEVIDSRTNQVCKVACMSCIRGHRTTSCGIPICRAKVFWTVKRPGRPSNSCTCRYGATGGCKCVVARSACPHKSKKGEKRSGECRCDEQGRYCCLLEPHHWDQLLSLQKPTVDFSQTKEQLDANQAGSTNGSVPQTPAYSMVGSPPSSAHSIPSTPAPPQHVHIMPNTYNNNNNPFHATTPTTTLKTRFGMMGIGVPMDSSRDVGIDVLTWQGQPPVAPREYNAQPVYNEPPPERESCCQAGEPVVHSARSPPPELDGTYTHQHNLHEMSLGANFNAVPTIVALSQVTSPPLPAFDYNHFENDYFRYQFPSAICQNCGLNGCTCRNCPPVFQNFNNTSWAQCCGRKHARDPQPSPVPSKVARTENYSVDPAIHSQPELVQAYQSDVFPQQDTFPLNGNHFINEYNEMELPPPGLPPELDPFTLQEGPNGLNHDFHIPELEFNDFLNSEFNTTHDTTTQAGTTAVDSDACRTENGDGDGDAAESRTGGCCSSES